MQSTSQLYNSILSGAHRFEVKLSVAGADYGMVSMFLQKSKQQLRVGRDITSRFKW